jgi:hypothetical protein
LQFARDRWSRGHWILIGILVAIAVGTTAYELSFPAPTCRDWICLQGFDGVLSGFAWSFSLLFAGALLLLARYARGWRAHWRALAYSAAIVVCFTLAFPGAFVVGAGIGGPIKDFQIARGNARIRSLLTLLRWSYRSDPAGGVEGFAEIRAGKTGDFTLRVATETLTSAPCQCDESELYRLALRAGDKATFRFKLVCVEMPERLPSKDCPTVPSRLYFRFLGGPDKALEELERDESSLNFVPWVSSPEGDGHTLNLPLPPPELIGP